MKRACLLLAAVLSLPSCDSATSPQQFSLVVRGAGSGAGSVSSAPAGIGCTISAGVATGDCNESHSSGTTVTLTASAGAGSIFNGWSGSGVSCPGTGSCAVTVESALNVTASFTRQFTLSLAGSGSGSGAVSSSPGGIACNVTSGVAGGDCDGIYSQGTAVTLTASATAGSVFDGWSGPGITCAGTAACVVAIDAARSVTATFIQQFTLTIANTGAAAGMGQGNGQVTSTPAGIDCALASGLTSNACAAAFNTGTIVTLAASASGGSVFVGWGGDGSSCSGTAPCDVTLSAARTVSVNFTQQFSLSIAGAGSGAGTITSDPPGIDCDIAAGAVGNDCAEPFLSGQLIVLSAAPVPGSIFAGWTGDGITCPEASCQLTLDAARMVVATFIANHQLTVLGAGAGTGVVTSAPAGITCASVAGATSGDCTEVVSSGTVLTLTAGALAGSVFTGWSGAGIACAGTAPCVVTLDAELNVTATFGLANRTVTIEGTGSGSGSVTSAPPGINCAITGVSETGACQAEFAFGTVVTLTATPAVGSAFVAWGADCAGAGVCQLTLNGAKLDWTGSANFTDVAGTKVSLTTQPADTGRSGVVLARQPVLQLRDAANNPITQAGVEVSVSVQSGTGTLGGATTVLTNAAGVATFVNLSISGAGPHVLQFNSPGRMGTTSTTTTLPVALSNGIPVNNLSGALGSARWYVLDVPAGQTSLTVMTSGGAGDPDLFVRQGALPNLTTFGCKSETPTTAEGCVFGTPAAGPWYILVYGFANYAGVTLTATYTTGGGCTLMSPGDADGDRLPDCVETNTGTFVSATNTGTNPNDADTDDDGIGDGDEVLGSTGGLNLPALGVSPLRKDILIEFDWFTDALDCGAHSHRPTAGAIGKVVAAFANASTVTNPDGSTGINVIADYGQGGALTGGNLIADADGVLAGFVNSVEFRNDKVANMAANRQLYFHYTILPHRYDTNSGSSGQAELPGNDLIVSLQCFGSDQNVANTILHELGHNLNLHHGGFEATNYKPNYNSVMNYLYQFPGVDTDCTPPGNGLLNYSLGTRPPLNENNLDERNGVCGNPPGPGWDWNLDGDALDFGFARDINVDGGGTGDGVLTTLMDYNDWANLFFGGLNDADGAPVIRQQIVSCPDIPVAFRRR